MANKILLDLLKVVVGFGLLWVCFYFIPWSPDDEGLDYSVESEIALGEYIIEQMIEEGGEDYLIRSAYIDSIVWTISDRLIDSLTTSEYEYSFYILDNKEVNAFALPGGNIVINAQLIEFAESPEELAAVIAHEMGHVEERHIVKRLIKEFGIQILLGSIGGDVIVLNEISETAASTYFDRKQEGEADDFALELLNKTNINPRSLGTFFRRLKREYGHDSDFDFFQTHPNVNSRIQKSFSFEIDDETTYEPYKLNWSDFQDSVRVRV